MGLVRVLLYCAQFHLGVTSLNEEAFFSDVLYSVFSVF